MTLLVTVVTDNVTTLALSYRVTLLPTPEALLLVTTANITLVALLTTLETNNICRSISPLRPPLIIQPLFTLVSWALYGFRRLCCPLPLRSLITL